MSTRERILAIRLINKVLKRPMFAEALGIESVQREGDSGGLDLSDASGLSRSYYHLCEK